MSPALTVNFVTLNGCQMPEKGAYLIVNAVRILHEMGLAPQFKLFVMGHIEAGVRPELDKFDNVISVGAYKPDELNTLLEDKHVGLVTPLWEEAYGYVGVEFLAKGIPVIGNQRGGVVDYTKDNETGWLNKANTAEGLAQIMAGIIHEPQQILNLNNYILAHHGEIIKTLDQHFIEMDQVYKQLIAAKQEHHILHNELQHATS